MHRLTSVLATALLVATGAQAQTSLYDPEQLPAFHGKVQQFSLTARAELDGLILEDGTEVRVFPRLSTQLAFAVKPGDTVTVHGVKASNLPLVQALSVRNDATGASLSDPMVPGTAASGFNPQLQPRQMEARGRVRLTLHGPDGEVNGLVLDDGTILRFAFAGAVQTPDCLKPGREVIARGTGQITLLGRVLETRQVAIDNDRLVTDPAPPSRVIIQLPSRSMQPGSPLPLLNPPAR